MIRINKSSNGKYANQDNCSSNLKIGLIFVKSNSIPDVTLQDMKDSDGQSSHTWEDKLIVVAGNNYNVENMCQFDSSQDENRSPRKACLNIHQHQSSAGTLGGHILDQPLLQSNIVEMHFDSVFKDKTTILSLELFKCVNLRVLSLRHNNLMSLPAEIGRLSQLRTLILTENCLTFNTIPFTLTFCRHLKELYLDHNLLDGLPGFLLDMLQLQTVYRHGNHNYFKSTFMWYHTAERERVMPVKPNQKNKINKKSDSALYQPQSLESYSIKALIEAKVNFFSPGMLPVTLQDYVAKVYTKYKICAYCSSASYDYQTGFRVFTFKDPYLGNTCVPFEHWTCSHDCGVALEEPAHRQERIQSRKLNKKYQNYIKSEEAKFNHKPAEKRLSTCVVM